MLKLVNIIIRTHNEAKWLPLCLDSVFAQSYRAFKVTIVDSGSDDLTLEIAKKYEVKICQVENYKPGDAINVGAEQVPDADFLVCLSAHCVPIGVTWLETLVEFIEDDERMVAATGRQVPMNFTSSDDMRDLFMMFPEQDFVSNRIFLHNANSIIRKKFWDLEKFDPDIKHIEDIIWAKIMIDRGLKLGFASKSMVAHYHGPNQHANYASFRAKNLTNILIEQELMQTAHLRDLVINPDRFLLTLFWGTRENCLNNWLLKSDNTIFLKELYLYTPEKSIKEILFELQFYLRQTYPQSYYIQICNNETTKTQFERLYKHFWNSFSSNLVSVFGDSGNYWILHEDNLSPIQFSLDIAHRKQKIFKSKLTQGSILSINDLFLGIGQPNEIEPFLCEEIGDD